MEIPYAETELYALRNKNNCKNIILLRWSHFEKRRLRKLDITGRCVKDKGSDTLECYVNLKER